MSLAIASAAIAVSLPSMGLPDPEWNGFVSLWAARPGEWPAIPAMFAHHGFTHLFLNLGAIAVFGPPAERRLGRIGMGVMALTVGPIALWVQANVVGVPAMGLSGAIAALMGHAAATTPRRPVGLFVGGWMAWQALGALDWWGNAAQVGYGAHLSGAALGIAIALVSRRWSR